MLLTIQITITNTGIFFTSPLSAVSAKFLKLKLCCLLSVFSSMPSLGEGSERKKHLPDGLSQPHLLHIIAACENTCAFGLHFFPLSSILYSVSYSFLDSLPVVGRRGIMFWSILSLRWSYMWHRHARHVTIWVGSTEASARATFASLIFILSWDRLEEWPAESIRYLSLCFIITERPQNAKPNDLVLLECWHYRPEESSPTADTIYTNRTTQKWKTIAELCTIHALLTISLSLAI